MLEVVEHEQQPLGMERGSEPPFIRPKAPMPSCLVRVSLALQVYRLDGK